MIMTTATELFNSSELSLAAYANLITGTPTEQQILALQQDGDGMSEQQAIQFAARYPTVIAVADFPGSGFQATVFKRGKRCRRDYFLNSCEVVL